MGILSHFLSSKSEFPFKPPKQPPASRTIQNHLKVGLQTLIHPTPKQPPRIVHSYTLSTSISTSLNLPSPPPPCPPPPPPPPSWLFGSCLMGDMIGAESGDYMSSNVEDLHEPDKRNHSRSKYRRTKKREFPPPISLLSESGGMPLVFKRETTPDRRLTIRAERVTRHQYFQPHRHNGRLLMKLIPPPLPDDAAYCHDCRQPITTHDDSEIEDDLDFDQRQVTEEELESETEECEDIRKVVGYGEGLVRASVPFWKGKAIDGPNRYLGRPGSAPLLPVTTVM